MGLRRPRCCIIIDMLMMFSTMLELSITVKSGPIRRCNAVFTAPIKSQQLHGKFAYTNRHKHIPLSAGARRMHMFGEISLLCRSADVSKTANSVTIPLAEEPNVAERNILIAVDDSDVCLVPLISVPPPPMHAHARTHQHSHHHFTHLPTSCTQHGVPDFEYVSSSVACIIWIKHSTLVLSHVPVISLLTEFNVSHPQPYFSYIAVS